MLCCARWSPPTIATEVVTSCSRSLRLLAVTTISFAEASASRISLPPASLCAHAVLDACRASTAANALVKLLILFPPKSTIFNDDHFLRNDHLVQNDHTVFQEKSVHRSEEHTSELQSLMRISYAVFCLTKKKTPKKLHI